MTAFRRALDAVGRAVIAVACRREPRTMDPGKLMEEWAVGSGDWSWFDELLDLTDREDVQFLEFIDTIKAEGVRHPVLLGNDGRVWDGHHRILAAYYAGVPVPVEYAGKRWHPVERVRGWGR